MALNTKAVALSIGFFTIIISAAFSTALALPLATSVNIAQCPLTIEQAAYGMAASLIALGVIVFMQINQKANNVPPESLQNFLTNKK